jgi:hypothetical protein
MVLFRRDMAFIQQAGGPCAQINFSSHRSPAFATFHERIVFIHDTLPCLPPDRHGVIP